MSDRISQILAMPEWSWAAAWVSIGAPRRPGMICVQSAGKSFELRSGSIPEHTTAIGCGGWDAGSSGRGDDGLLHWIGIDLDVRGVAAAIPGHAEKKTLYDSTEEALAAALLVRDLAVGAAEIRLSKSGRGVHIRIAVAAGVVNGREAGKSLGVAAYAAKHIARAAGIKCDTTVLGRQNLWFWSAAPGPRGFELQAPAEGLYRIPEAFKREPAVIAQVSPATPIPAPAMPAGNVRGITDEDRARQYVGKAKRASEPGRNKALHDLAYYVLERFVIGETLLTEILLEWSRGCSPAIDEHEARATIHSAWNGAHSKGVIGTKHTEPKGRAASKPAAAAAPPKDPPPPRAGDDAPAEDRDGEGAGGAKGEGRPDYQDLARRYLRERGHGEPGPDCRMVHYRNEYHSWTGRVYRPLSPDDAKNSVTSFLQNLPSVRHKVSQSLSGNVLANVQSLVHLADVHDMPGWRTVEEGGLLAGWAPAPGVVAMENGILDILAAMIGAGDALQEHTPRFFTPVLLPYKYDPDATCPTWLKFLEQMFPDAGVRQLLAELFGYCLTFDTSQGKFAILEGQGANGKSVVCAALRAVLGTENVSAVPLEAFKGERTFPIAATVNKLANIHTDMSEIEQSAEGIIKAFADGEPMTVERKTKDAFTFKPTARLVFATNVLPRFSDRSDGIWRKMLLIPCTVQILDESKQDKRLGNAEFWATSGELSGIFNWALAGKRSLHERRYFLEPDVCKAAKGEFKKKTHAESTFLDDYVRGVEKAETPAPVLYSNYAKWATDNGYKKMAANNFAECVKRKFTRATLSPNPQTYPHINPGSFVTEKRRGRIWTGIELVPQFSDEDAPQEAEVQRA
jgi:P4 family phage/plasmid primase-like protien